VLVASIHVGISSPGLYVSIAAGLAIRIHSPAASMRTNLSGAGDTQSCQQPIGSIAAVRCENSFHQRQDSCTLEKVELGRILLEDLGEGKLLYGASPIIGRVERDVCGGIGLVGVLDEQESIGIGRTDWSWPQT
jgi:hypothetical protein